MVLSYGQRGYLDQCKDGRWEAQVGLIKMTLEEKNLTSFKPSRKASQKKQVNVVKRTSGRGTSSQTGSSRASAMEEAMDELDAFIDQALLNNMTQLISSMVSEQVLSIEGVTKYLQRNKHVKEFGTPHKCWRQWCDYCDL